MYRLSMRTEMSWFKHAILIGSEQDSYVSFQSAMVELPMRNVRTEYVEM
jgi:hypothetical protein